MTIAPIPADLFIALSIIADKKQTLFHYFQSILETLADEKASENSSIKLKLNSIIANLIFYKTIKPKIEKKTAVPDK